MDNFVIYIVNNILFETYINLYGIFQVVSSLQGIAESTESSIIEDSSPEKSSLPSDEPDITNSQGNLANYSKRVNHTEKIRKQNILVKVIRRSRTRKPKDKGRSEKLKIMFDFKMFCF